MAYTKVGRLGVFRGAVGLALRDGLLSNGEKRLLVKMAHALRLNEEQPKAAYDAVLAGEDIDGGEDLGLEETRRVYEQVLEAFLLHTDRSEAELILVAYLRHTFNIDDTEHRAIARSMVRGLKGDCGDWYLPQPASCWLGRSDPSRGRGERSLEGWKGGLE